jgi:hypothetical protein
MTSKTNGRKYVLRNQNTMHRRSRLLPSRSARVHARDTTY